MSLKDTLLLILDTLMSICLCIVQWDEKELDTHFTQNVYFCTPNFKIFAKALFGKPLKMTAYCVSV